MGMQRNSLKLLIEDNNIRGEESKRKIIVPLLHITGLYTLRPYGAWATKNRSRAAPFVRFSLRHISGVAWNCFAIPLSQPQKRRIQLLRYATFGLKELTKKIK
jgi:hypothetical protein